jgi:hypothetical protein
MAVRDVHAGSLATSSALSAYYVPKLIPPHEVIRVLNGAKVRFLLLGAHGLGGWIGKPRATEDVDVLIGARGHKKAVRALLAAFPHLRGEDHEVVTRLRDPETGNVVVDVMKANQPLYRDALKHTRKVESEGQTYEIPSLELALAMKFAAMISLTRSDEDKLTDASDFIKMVKANHDIDLDKLHALGQLVYNGGGDEVVEKVRQVRAGEKLNL